MKYAILNKSRKKPLILSLNLVVSNMYFLLKLLILNNFKISLPIFQELLKIFYTKNIPKYPPNIPKQFSRFPV